MATGDSGGPLTVQTTDPTPRKIQVGVLRYSKALIGKSKNYVTMTKLFRL